LSPFAEEIATKSKDQTANRTSTDYVKFTPDYRVTLRMLDGNAKTVWKHFIEAANAGRGNSVVCPNVTAQTKVCPIEAATEGLPKDNQERKNSFARRRYITNVLDRTPFTTCEACGTKTPGQTCVSCKASLKDHDFAPLNKIKILEGGPRLFLDGLNAIDRMQKEDIGKDITEYDITFTTTGTGRDKKIAPLPRPVSELEADALLDKETGEPQKRYDLELLAEPTSLEVINLMLTGASNEEIANATAGSKPLPF
jgi:hypothetical protein